MRAERAENTRAAEELSGSKAARRHAPSVPSTPGMSTANRGIYASMVTVRFGSVTSNFPVRMHCSVHKRLLNKRFGSAGSVSKKNDSTGSVPPVYSKKTTSSRSSSWQQLLTESPSVVMESQSGS